jgi:hypothetical protein
VAIVTAPAIGRAWWVDHGQYNWRWVFLINIPIRLLSLFRRIGLHDPRRSEEETARQEAAED